MKKRAGLGVVELVRFVDVAALFEEFGGHAATMPGWFGQDSFSRKGVAIEFLELDAREGREGPRGLLEKMLLDRKLRDKSLLC